MPDIVIFDAPWGSSLKWMTVLSVLILVGLPVASLLTGPRDNLVWRLSLVVLPLGILATAACFMIRGYVVMPDALLVQRLGWYTKLELTDLRSVLADSRAMKGSIRTFGNGGLFSFSGAFWNRRLGAYRAFATDPARAVVLKFTNRVVVVTPGDPQALVAKLIEVRALPKEEPNRS